MPNFSETRLGYRDPIFAILNATSGDVLNATLMQAPSTYIQNPGKVTRGTGSEMYLSHHIKGDFGGARCAKGDCCYAARFDGATMTWIRIFEDIGAQYNNYNCRSNAVPSSDGNQVFVGGRNLVAMLKASDGSVIVSKPITNCSEVRGLAVIGSDLYVVGRSIYMGIGVDSVAVSSPIAGPTNAKYWSFILKFSTTATGLTATAGTWIGSDEPVVTEVWSVNQAYNVSGYPDAVVVAMEQFGSIFKTGTGFVSDTFMTTAGSSTVRFSLGVVALIDGATLNGIDATLFAGKSGTPYIIGNSTSEIEDYDRFFYATSDARTGLIYAGGEIDRNRASVAIAKTTCEPWDFQPGFPLHRLGITKYNTTLELPLWRA